MITSLPTADHEAPRAMPQRPQIRILELRCADGSGGGPEKTILLGAKLLAPERFHVTVCYVRDIRDTAFDLDKRAASLGLDYVEILQRHAVDSLILRQARRITRERSIDIVHSHDYKTDLLALLLARMEGVIPVSTVHGYSGTSLRERLVYYPTDRRLLAGFPKVIAVSTALKKMLLRAGVMDERVRVVPNGIDSRVFRRQEELVTTSRQFLGFPPDALIIGAVGRLSREKRIDVLLDAVRLLATGRPKLRLVLMGDGPERQNLLASARKLGVAHLCNFLGHCPNTRELYHALHVLVQSSDTEGTSNVLLEAMALEIPVVATAVGGTSDLIRPCKHGLLVPRRDPEGLAAAIDSTLSEPTATRVRVAAARARVERELSFERRMAKVAAVYDEVYARNARGWRRNCNNAISHPVPRGREA